MVGEEKNGTPKAYYLTPVSYSHTFCIRLEKPTFPGGLHFIATTFIALDIIMESTEYLTKGGSKRAKLIVDENGKESILFEYHISRVYPNHDQWGVYGKISVDNFLKVVDFRRRERRTLMNTTDTMFSVGRRMNIYTKVNRFQTYSGKPHYKTMFRIEIAGDCNTPFTLTWTQVDITKSLIENYASLL